MATFAQWVQGARPRTLPMAIAPVIVGSAAAFGLGAFDPLRAVLAALVAVLLQVGVNYANDYSDGVRGTDDNRVGPFRLVGGGAAEPGAVKRAAFLSFGAAAVFGLVLVGLSQAWWLLIVGVASVLAAWGYTGGRRPYGYLGLGDVFVFVFFGLVATLGTTYTQALTLSPASWAGAIATGLIADALLMANNVRDIPTDTVAGKRTLAVRLGDRAARRSYPVMLGAAIVAALLLAPANPWMLLALVLVPACIKPSRTMVSGTAGPGLIPVLQQTGFINLGFSVLFAVASVLGRV